MTPYIDNIFVNENVCTAACVRDHLLQFGLARKDPEQLRDGTHVLGLRVMEKHGKLQWCCGGELPMLPDILARRSIFSLCGKLTGHLPVCGWLHVTTTSLRRYTNCDNRPGQRNTRPTPDSDAIGYNCANGAEGFSAS